MMFENGIDQGTAAVIGSVLLFLGVVVQTRRASRDSVPQAKETKEAQAQQVVEALTFGENLNLTKYIREEVEKGVEAAVETATRPLREELASVKDLLAGVYGRFDRMRQGFREYRDDVRRRWGKQPEPPAVPRHLSDLLDETDADTWTRVRIQELVDHNREHASEP